MECSTTINYADYPVSIIVEGHHCEYIQNELKVETISAYA